MHKLVLFLFCFSIYSDPIGEVRPWMGIIISDGENSVLVKQAVKGTPAEKAGLQTGDFIFKIDTTIIKTKEELISYVQSKGVGNLVTVFFNRNKLSKETSLNLEAKPDMVSLLKKQLIGKKVPPFELELISRKGRITEKNLLGKVTVLEFWATWCIPCVSSHVILSEFSKKNPSVQVFGISSEEKTKLEKYWNEKKLHFPSIWDGSNVLHDFFNVSSIPFSVVVDKAGVIQNVELGGGFYLEENLKKALEISK
jgi:thiol-disulfide isomerase/thioredoxin